MKYTKKEGLVSLNTIKLRMMYNLEKTLLENSQELELLSEIKGKWYSCIEDVRTLAGIGTSNVNVNVQDQVQQFNQDGSFILYKKTLDKGLVILYKGKWKCKKDKGYSITLEDGNFYDSDKKTWSGPNKNKSFKLPATPQRPIQQTTTTNTGAKNQYAIYKPKEDGSGSYELIDLDGRSPIVAGRDKAYYAQDLFPDKKPNEWPKNVSQKEFFDIIYGRKNLIALNKILPIGDGEKRAFETKDRQEKLKRLQLLKQLKVAFENRSPMGFGWSKPGVQEEYWDLINELEGGFKPSGSLYNTPEPKPPKIVGQYISTPGANFKVQWSYTRYEQGEPVTYTFEDFRNGGAEYQKYYDQFLMDRKKWTLANTSHTLLTVAQIGALFIPVIGPAISAGLSLGEAALFKAQGDDFMAGLMLIFTVLPGAGKLIPELKGLSNPVKSKISKYITKGSRTTKLSPTEKMIADKIIKNQAALKAMGLIAKFYLKIRTLIHKMNPLTMMRFANFLIKKNPVMTTLIGEGVKMGGITYTWKEIYLKYNKAKKSKNSYEISRIEEAVKQEQERIVTQLENPTSAQEAKMQGVDTEKLDTEICAEFPEYC